MTSLKSPVTRLTQAAVRDAGRRRHVVVTLDIDGIWLRQKGCRVKYQLPFELAWDCAIKAYAREQARLKAAVKKGRR